MMNIKLLAAMAIALPLFTVGCAKKEAPAQEQPASEATATEQVLSAEQQAAIAAVDQPNPEAVADSNEASATASAESASTPEAVQ